MRVGLLTSLVDKVQHAYGWTDDYILDLRVSRMVQIQEAIFQREEIKHWEDLKVVEWQVRSLASMIANTIEDDKARKTMVEAAHGLTLTGDPTSKSTQSSKRRGPKTYRLLTGEEIPASELKNYSYDEVDHAEENKKFTDKARQKNAGADLFSALGGLTRN